MDDVALLGICLIVFLLNLFILGRLCRSPLSHLRLTLSKVSIVIVTPRLHVSKLRIWNETTACLGQTTVEFPSRSVQVWAHTPTRILYPSRTGYLKYSSLFLQISHPWKASEVPTKDSTSGLTARPNITDNFLSETQHCFLCFVHILTCRYPDGEPPCFVLVLGTVLCPLNPVFLILALHTCASSHLWV